MHLGSGVFHLVMEGMRAFTHRLLKQTEPKMMTMEKQTKGKSELNVLRDEAGHGKQGNILAEILRACLDGRGRVEKEN